MSAAYFPYYEDKQDKGPAAEQTARRFLETKGFKFLQANYQTRLGELDLIMRKKDTLVFVEVRARGRSDFGSAEETVNYYKQRKIIRAALMYMKISGWIARPVRFDVVSITPEGITHFEDAFQAPAGLYTL